MLSIGPTNQGFGLFLIQVRPIFVPLRRTNNIQLVFGRAYTPPILYPAIVPYEGTMFKGKNFYFSVVSRSIFCRK